MSFSFLSISKAIALRIKVSMCALPSSPTIFAASYLIESNFFLMRSVSVRSCLCSEGFK